VETFVYSPTAVGAEQDSFVYSPTAVGVEQNSFVYSPTAVGVEQNSFAEAWPRFYSPDYMGLQQDFVCTDLTLAF
jgi:hypothetical protein